MIDRARRLTWVLGWPLRALLIATIRVYRISLGLVLGGRCRFYPSCSVYAERAIAELGVLRGLPLSVWRVLRCSPLTAGGVDHPPVPRRAVVYDAAIHQRQPLRPGGGNGKSHVGEGAGA